MPLAFLTMILRESAYSTTPSALATIVEPESRAAIYSTPVPTIGDSQVINGTAYRAYWGDLAEYYDADNEYPVGTLMTFGGNKEVTIATEDCNAVVSSNPGVILNNGETFEHPCKLALCGRVPVRTIGKVNKFDYLTLSEIPGVARALEDKKFPMNVIARALEDKDSEE